MRRFLIFASLAIAALFAVAHPAEARARVGVSLNFGYPGYYGYGPYYPAYYGYYPYGAYYAPRPVVVAAPAYAAPVYAAPPAGAVIREGRDSTGNYCREYQSNTTIDGRAVPTYGTACQRPDGTWQIVN